MKNDPSDIRIHRSQVGIIGDYANVEGGIHFHLPSSGIPLQRPPRPEHFIGREKELAQLLQDLQPGKVITLCGPGGIGKTALAAEAIWRLAPGDEPPKLFPDGIIFYTFYGNPDPDLALEHFARSFGVEPKPTPAAAALQALAGKRALLVLDGTEEADNLQSLLEVRGECGVLVTSRTNEDAVADWQEIVPLQLDMAVELLQAWGGKYVVDGAISQQICELMGCLPLAVRLVGRYLTHRKQKAETFLLWLQASPLEALDQGNRREKSVPVLLEQSLEQISLKAQQALAVTGMLALTSFDGIVVATALDISEVEVGHQLGELVSYGLLSRPGERYEVSHALIHTYASKRLSVDSDALTRLASYYECFATEQNRQVFQDYVKMDAERAHLMQILKICYNRKKWKVVKKLSWAMNDYLDIRVWWTEWQTALEMGVEATQKLGDRKDEGAFLDYLGIASRKQGQMEKAITYHKQALAIHRKIGSLRHEGIDLGNLGVTYHNLKQFEQAIKCLTQALDIARAIGDRRNEGAWLGNLGNTYRRLSQINQAIDCYERALVIDRESGNLRSVAHQLGNLGLVYHTLGQRGKAIIYHKQALGIHQLIGDRRHEGIDLVNLGIIYLEQEQFGQAITYSQQALGIYHDIDDLRGEISALAILGGTYTALKKEEQALTYFNQALDLYQDISDLRSEKAGVLAGIGIAYRALGQMGQAKHYLHQSLAIFEEIQSPSVDSVRKLLAEL